MLPNLQPLGNDLTILSDLSPLRARSFASVSRVEFSVSCLEIHGSGPGPEMAYREQREGTWRCTAGREGTGERISRDAPVMAEEVDLGVDFPEPMIGGGALHQSARHSGGSLQDLNHGREAIPKRLV